MFYKYLNILILVFMAGSKEEIRYGDLLDEIAEDLRILGHPQRLRILDVLKRQGELCVSEIVRRTKIAQPVVSQHLSKMRASGLVVSRRDSHLVSYWIGTEIAAVVAECLQRKFEGLPKI